MSKNKKGRTISGVYKICMLLSLICCFNLGEKTAPEFTKSCMCSPLWVALKKMCTSFTHNVCRNWSVYTWHYSYNRSVTY